MQSDGDALSSQLQEEFAQILRVCQRLCFITRAKELQLEGRQQARAYLDRIGVLKEAAIARLDEESANLLLCWESVIQALAAELDMWIALKDDAPDSAWDDLVRAQSAAHDAVAAHEMATDLNLPNYIRKLHALEHFVFPPQLFTSVGAVIRRAKCSICQLDYGTCDHLAGRPYMGQMCVREVVEADLREVSLVQEPANKSCRVFRISDDNGVVRNVMSWLPETSQLEYEAP